MTGHDIAVLVGFVGILEVLIVSVFALLDAARRILKQALLRKIYHVYVPIYHVHVP